MNEIPHDIQDIQETATDQRADGVTTCDAYQLIESMMRAGKYTEMQLDGVLASVNLSSAKWNALRHLMAAGGQLPLGQLAAKLSCVKSNATQLVDRLEAESLVCRMPDPDDRRSIRAELTPEGRRAFALGQRVVQEFEQQLLDDYSAEERIMLRRLLARMGGV